MNDLVLPVTRYALSGDLNIAYQSMGNGPLDMIIVPGGWSHVEFMHELPGYTEVLRRLSTFSRVITFDKRGQGLSDRDVGAPSLEQRMDDVRAIMETVGSQRAALLGFSEGGPMSVLFAATHPERVSHLVLVGGFTTGRLKLDPSRSEAFEEGLSSLAKNWGSGITIKMLNPSEAENADAVARFAKFERLSTSPGAFKSFFRLNAQIDVTSILPTLRVPTLVLHRRTDALVRVERGRELAAQIPGAKYIEYPDGDHLPFAGETDALLGDIEEFITGHRESSRSDLQRVLATVLFTDIVGSTRVAVEIGDQAWHRLLDSHDQLAKQIVEQHRGVLVKSTGDGILATFDGPGRAVRCALALGAASKQIGLPLRAGLHTGEIEIRGRDIGGIAVHAAARVMGQSQSSEVLVSRVVTDLVAGAGLKFSERGSHELKGLPGRWDLFAANA
ncbi:adenylate/guanylate cyclase domain-containing protein [Bradyrhizobium sp. SRL28]|uniref:adenylate/guanylate cyclase domain-containing protein n=1 Tax=Bradyrhizobium sp. SRL28 TaxID=2836178 RepID=UPI001BDDE4F0|nr:adenylate/guanylate cyclase domain-containing protein [Bradyrhizobium sp. SRL28]MBT1517542.1 adenylate/guanylate cyclase domain-containing protein [Bradyrhizobium sp. SRL28]